QLRGGVEVLSLEPLLPQIGGLERMRVRRDDPVCVPRHVELLLPTRAGSWLFRRRNRVAGENKLLPERESIFPWRIGLHARLNEDGPRNADGPTGSLHAASAAPLPIRATPGGSGGGDASGLR